MKLNEMLKISIGIKLYESVSFGGMQKVIYDYVLKQMKGIPSDAKFNSENDRFWVDDFDQAYENLTSDRINIDNIYDSLSYAISSVSEKIADYYGNSMNHPPGYKPVKLKVIEIDDVKEKDLDDMIKTISPKVFEDFMKQEKEAAEEKKKIRAEEVKKAGGKIKEIAEFIKKHQAQSLADFLKLCLRLSKTEKGLKDLKDLYFPDYVTKEEIKDIKTIDDIKTIHKKPTDYIEMIVDGIYRKRIKKEDEYLEGLCYTVTRSTALSKKLMTMI